MLVVYLVFPRGNDVVPIRLSALATVGEDRISLAPLHTTTKPIRDRTVSTRDVLYSSQNASRRRKYVLDLEFSS